MSKVMVVSFQSLTADSGQGMARLGHALSKELHKRGMLKTFVVHSKGKHDAPFPSEPVSKWSRLYLFALNKLDKIFKFPVHRFRFTQELLFDWFCAKKLDRSVKVLFSTQPYLKRTFKKAQQLGIKTFLLSGTPEDNYIYKLVTEEKKFIGTNETDAYTYDRRNKYFNESMKYLDVVVGFFPNVYQTYVDSEAFTGECVNLSGHILPNIPPYSLEEREINTSQFAIGYLAYTAILKGLHYLLEAWKQLQEEDTIPNATLVIGGPTHPTINEYINKHYKNLNGVSYKGQVNNIPEFMQGLDLFVVPSLIDAGPLSALEAAHYAIPVLITENCGSAELLERGEGGAYTIPIRDVAAIKEKILFAYNNRTANHQKGLIAKENLDNYSFEEYINNLGNFLEERANEQ